MAGVALVAGSREALKHSLTLAFTDPLLLRQLRDRIRAVRRPGAARAVAELLLSEVSQRTERAS